MEHIENHSPRAESGGRAASSESVHEYAVDAVEEIGILTHRGYTDTEDLAVLLGRLVDDPRFLPHYGLLTDFSECRLAVTPSELGALAERYEAKLGSRTIRSAILVDSTRETALSMLYERRRERRRTVVVFSGREAALAFLRGED